jgi:hypothetical protein
LDAPQRRIPLWIKVAYTAFVALLVPVYLIDYGPTNFLYFCDIALLLTVYAMWRERPLPASIALVGILVAQTLWITDFITRMVGIPVTGADGMTAYMFNPTYPLFTRFLSFFHFWLPLLLLYVVKRLGYDKRALKWTTLGGWAVLSICFFFMPPPPAPADEPNLPVNINMVHGFSDKAPQTAMPPLANFAMMIGLWFAIGCLPPHLILSRWFVRSEETPSA